jgi:very-short-patch-repair endonuclease
MEKVARARRLRRDQTEAERKFWNEVRSCRFGGLKFRQTPIVGYYADFVCWDAKMIIELDGGQHGEQREYDAQRTKILEDAGFQVLRFWNNDVMTNIEGVMEKVSETIGISGHDTN